MKTPIQEIDELLEQLDPAVLTKIYQLIKLIIQEQNASN